MLHNGDASPSRRYLYEMMQRDPTFRSLSTEDLLACIQMYDDIFDHRAGVLTAEETSAVRHLLSLLNGELDERTERHRSKEFPAIHVPSALAPAEPKGEGWLRKFFR